MEENNSIAENTEKMTFPEFAVYVRDNLAEAVNEASNIDSAKIFIPFTSENMIFRGDFNYGELGDGDAAFKETDRMIKDCADRMCQCFQSGFPESQRDSMVSNIICEFGFEYTAYVLANYIRYKNSPMPDMYGENIWAQKTIQEINRLKPGFHPMLFSVKPDDEPLKAFAMIFRERSRESCRAEAELLTQTMTPMLTNDFSFNGEPLDETGVYFQNNQAFGITTAVIPLKSYYASYLCPSGSDAASLHEIMRDIAKNALVTSCFMGEMPFQIETYRGPYDVMYLKPNDRIYLKAVNAAANPPQGHGDMRTLCKQIGDISLQMRMVSFDINGNQTSIDLRRFHQKLIGGTVDDIYRLAMESTRLLFTPVTKTIGETMEELLGFNPDPDNQKHMHVITDYRKSEAASYMFDPVVLWEVSGDYGGDNLLLMPSSIHESMAMPAKAVDAEDLALVVRKINDSQVKVGERLSNAVYFYDAVDRSIRPAAGLEYGDIKNPLQKTSEPDVKSPEDSDPDQVQLVKMKSPKL